MQRTCFDQMQCPIARSLERVGEWWTILILRDALRGYTRFDQFQKSLPIAPNMLTRRLHGLVKAGLLARRRYSEHPPRHEYLLTPRGRDFQPVIVSLFAWGRKHFAPVGASARLIHADTGAEADPVLLDRRSGQPITEHDFVFVRGEATGVRLYQPPVRTRLKRSASRGKLAARKRTLR